MCYSPWGGKASDRTKCLTLPCVRYWGKTEYWHDSWFEFTVQVGVGRSSQVVKNPLASAGDAGWIPRKWQPAPVFLPGKFHRERSLVGFRFMESQKVWLFQQLDGENTCALTRLLWAGNAWAEPQRRLGRKRQVRGSEAPAWGEPTYCWGLGPLRTDLAPKVTVFSARLPQPRMEAIHAPGRFEGPQTQLILICGSN